MTAVDRTTAIQSIRPQYADRILDGTKTVEFRRQPLPPSVEQVLIWRTGKGAGIVGAYRICIQVTRSVADWAKVPEDRRGGWGIALPDLIDYAVHPYTGMLTLLAGIGVADVVRFARTERLDLTRGPQSWRYAPAGWETALSLATSEATS